MRRPRAWLLPWLAAAVVGGCSTDAADDAQDSSDTLDAPSNPLRPGSGAAELGQLGGTLRSTDGRLELAIPAGALLAVESVSISAAATLPAGALGEGFVIEPGALALHGPVELTWRVAPGVLPEGAGLERLRIARLAEDGASWVPLGAPLVDHELESVRGNTDALGTFALVLAGCLELEHCEAPSFCASDATCRLPGCTADAECEPSQLCVDGGCIEAVTCVDWRGCTPAEACDDGLCQPRAGCAGDDNACSDVETCIDGQCERGTGCVFDADCAVGELCLEGSCKAPTACAAGSGCECVDDSRCSPEKRCIDGTCTARTTCITSDDCSSGRVCVDGLCVGGT